MTTILRRHFCFVSVLLLFLCVFACKVSEDAAAAARQMTTTAVDLSSHYNSLAQAVTDSIALNELDASISKIPFEAKDRRPLEDTLSEISKRKDAALALAKLAASMSALSSSTVSSEVGTAASALGKELVDMKALPAGSPVPDAVGQAGKFLLQFVQQHKEKEAAQAMNGTLAAFVFLFEKEKPTYDSIFRTYIFLASQIARDLIARRAVDPSPMLTPALKPFDLTPLPADAQLRDTLQALALGRLQTSAEDASKRETDASSAMLSALEEMRSRVHLLATEKPMPIRDNPFSLKIVESWVASAI